MKTVTIKTNADLKAAVNSYADHVPQCELIFKDGNVIGARVGKARFEYINYGIQITREVDREEVEKHKVRVEHPNFQPITSYFDDNRAADKFAEPYLNMADTTVRQSLVTVQVDNDGKVIAEVRDGVEWPLGGVLELSREDEIVF